MLLLEENNLYALWRWSTEGHELIGNNPIKISILNLSSEAI